MTDLEQELQKIKKRNERVEIDKSWEKSYFRSLIIATLTYLVIAIFFVVIAIENPFVNAIVPTLGFLFSTMSLPVFKKIWLKYFHRK